VFEDCDHFFVEHCDRLADAAEDHLLTALGRDERMKLAAD
jgi:alpha/beta superfamily hydrolase